MDRALFAAATGMAAQQQNLDTIADDLANPTSPASRVGAKRSPSSSRRARAASERCRLGSHPMFVQGQLDAQRRALRSRDRRPGLLYRRRRARQALVHARRRVFARRGRYDARRRRAPARGRTRPERRAVALSVRKTARSPRRSRAVRGRRTDSHSGVRRARSPARDRRCALRSDAGIGPARNVAPGGENGPKLRFGMLERSQRHHRRIDDAHPLGPAGLRSQRERHPSRRRNAADCNNLQRT